MNAILLKVMRLVTASKTVKILGPLLVAAATGCDSLPSDTSDFYSADSVTVPITATFKQGALALKSPNKSLSFIKLGQIATTTAISGTINAAKPSQFIRMLAPNQVFQIALNVETTSNGSCHVGAQGFALASAKNLVLECASSEAPAPSNTAAQRTETQVPVSSTSAPATTASSTASSANLVFDKLCSKNQIKTDKDGKYCDCGQQKVHESWLKKQKNQQAAFASRCSNKPSDDSSQKKPN